MEAQIRKDDAMKKNSNRRIQTVMEHRIGWLTQWLKMRKFEIGEKRMVFLCICYCTFLAYLEPSEAKAKTTEINAMLIPPFSDDKLRKHIFLSIDLRESKLKYTNQTIKELLDIHAEEYEALDPDRNKKRLQEMACRKAQKTVRERKIVQLHGEGLTAREIAEQVGVSIKTVRRVITKNRKVTAAEEEQFAQWGWSDFPILSEEKGNSGLSEADVNSMQSGSLYCAYRTESTAALEQAQLKPSEILTNTKENLLLIGAAGTGKSYLIQQYLKSLSKKERKKVLVLAPTWKAASNLGGITVHKAFELDTKVQTTEPITKIPKALRGVHTIVIDEVSMLRIDVFNRIIQISQYFEQKRKRSIRFILVGDFGQLEPVCMPSDKEEIQKLYPSAEGILCFHAPLWDNLNLRKVKLFQIHRQAEAIFSQSLTQLKYGWTSTIDWFNDHCHLNSFDSNAITIVPTKELADNYNNAKLRDLWYTFYEEFEAQYDGPLTDDLPAPMKITLVSDCRIMILKNGKAYKNGQLGTLIDIENNNLRVQLDGSPETITIPKEKWVLSNGTTYSQYPVCLAYAITVHKAQGCTFDSINVDRGNGFWLPGQLYVALSRCKSVRNIHLVRKLQYQDLHYDEEALKMTF